MKSLLVCAAAAAVTLAGGTAAQAQHGHGHHHGHYHGHSHGFGYGGHVHVHGHIHGHIHGFPLGSHYSSYGVWYPYAYPSVVAAPVVLPAGAVSPAVITPVGWGTTSTSLKPNALPPYTGPGVTLRLPAEFPGSVYVQVDRQELEIKPGTQVALKDKASYLVEFDRGGGFGTSSADIAEGVYRFAVADKGWHLVPDAPPAGPRRNSLPGEPKK